MQDFDKDELDELRRRHRAMLTSKLAEFVQVYCPVSHGDVIFVEQSCAEGALVSAHAFVGNRFVTGPRIFLYLRFLLNAVAKYEGEDSMIS